VALVGLAVAAAALLMPRATVAVTLERMPFQAEVVYDVRVGAGTEGSGVLTIPATPVTTEVAVERTVPTTGRRLEPDGVAVAPVRFANPNPDPVTVEAETKLGSLNGQEFVLSAPVDVPAADAASGAAGQAEGEARAVQPGAGGNVGTGEIGGRLESGVYYSNRDQAAEGGTDREVAVVAREDLAAAFDAVDQAITEAAMTAVEGDGADGAVVLPGSATIVDKAGVVNLKEGDVADALGASATATVQVLVYDPGALTAAIDTRLPELAAVPEGRMLDPATVRFGEPVVESATAEGARLRVAVSGDAIPPFGPSERRALAERLAGGDIAAAGSLLGSLPGVRSSEIDFSPAWLPARMPGDPDRIEIEVVG
jgi:hypothetical protein